MQEVWLQKIYPPERSGGVPAKKLSTTIEFAEKCKIETPEYDKEEYKRNFRETVCRLYK